MAIKKKKKRKAGVSILNALRILLLFDVILGLYRLKSKVFHVKNKKKRGISVLSNLPIFSSMHSSVTWVSSVCNNFCFVSMGL